MIKYRTGLWNTTGVIIQPIEIEKETGSFVYIKGERMMKLEGQNHKIYDTYEEAKEHLIFKMEAKIETLKDGLTKANKALEHLKALKQ